jgi:hypothetical protein
VYFYRNRCIICEKENGMKKDKEEFVKLTVRITKADDEMIKRLRDEHCVNISQYIRKTLKELSGRLDHEKK